MSELPMTSLRTEFLASRQQEIQAIKTQRFDAIVALGGGYRLQRNAQTQAPRYLLSSYDPNNATYPWLLTGVKARAIAEEELVERNPESTIIALSRNKPTNQLSDAEAIISYEERNNPKLRKRIEQGDRFISDEISNSTITEVMELIGLAVSHDFTTIALITNDWQLLRAKKMYELFLNNPKEITSMLGASVNKIDPNSQDDVDEVLHRFNQTLQNFRSRNRSISFISAEAALEVRRPGLYTSMVNQAQSQNVFIRLTQQQLHEMDLKVFKYDIVDFTPDQNLGVLVRTDPLVNRLEEEKKGIRQLENVTYRAGRPDDPNNPFLIYCKRKLRLLTV